MNQGPAAGHGPMVGVVALQGGVAEHVRMLESAGARTLLVRRPQHLAGLDGIVLPGGESSTIDRLLRMFGLAEPLGALIAGGLPTLATCAGMVLLSENILDPAPGQQSLGVLPITVQRNAFGAQVASEEAVVDTVDGPVRAAFIRAPIVTEVGADVQVTARHRGRIVGVRRGAVTAVSFHPELSGDGSLHSRLVARCAAPRAAVPRA